MCIFLLNSFYNLLYYIMHLTALPKALLSHPYLYPHMKSITVSTATMES